MHQLHSWCYIKSLISVFFVSFLMKARRTDLRMSFTAAVFWTIQFLCYTPSTHPHEIPFFYRADIQGPADFMLFDFQVISKANVVDVCFWYDVIYCSVGYSYSYAMFLLLWKCTMKFEILIIRSILGSFEFIKSASDLVHQSGYDWTSC